MYVYVCVCVCVRVCVCVCVFNQLTDFFVQAFTNVLDSRKLSMLLPYIL